MEGTRTSAATEKVLEAFRTGAIIEAAQLVVVPRLLAADAPSRKWTFRNRICAALSGSFDARTFQQWLEAGRQVRRGETSKGFILLPILGKHRQRSQSTGSEIEDFQRELDSEEAAESRPRAFVGKAVFGYHQTDGTPIPGYDERGAFLDGLPLIDVARSWGIEVHVADALLLNGALGSFARDDKHDTGAIRLNVTNPEVFLHEMVHGAEQRLGSLAKGAVDRPGKEIVAELGAQILLASLGLPYATDRAFQYFKAFAAELELPVEQAVMRFLDRTAAAVELILTTADSLVPTRALAA